MAEKLVSDEVAIKCVELIAGLDRLVELAEETLSTLDPRLLSASHSHLRQGIQDLCMNVQSWKENLCIDDRIIQQARELQDDEF